MASASGNYARALVEVVLERQINPDSARQQLNSIVDTVRESQDLRRVWESPAIPVAQKQAVLDGIVAQEAVDKVIRNFVAVLIDHRRIAMLPEIAKLFDTELDAQLGFVQAQITSVRQLSPEERRELESRVENLTGKKVRAGYELNPNLLGGVMVRVGSTIYDGSVRGQLEKMRQQLSTQ